jgi:MOSC domain-containing protein YiiM
MKKSGKIIAVCRSDTKGVCKETVDVGVFKENFGMVSDAHASSDTHRQVSLLANESINKMRKMGLELKSGAFAENLTTEGIELVTIPIGTQVKIGQEVVLEISQIGKVCHTGCAISKQVGTCVMPKEGIFGKVIKGGKIVAGDTISVME